MQSFVEALRLKKYVVLYIIVLLATIILAAKFPIMDDEAYYIAFAKNLQASYVDHPPFVSYLNFFQTMFGLYSPLYVRSLVIVLHFISTFFLMAIVYNHCVQDKDITQKLLLTFLLAYVIPVFGFFSFFIMPDTGLILSLSFLLWVADKVVRVGHLTWKNAAGLGLGLGIGLLSKYHILLLGGGILFGLSLELALRSKFKGLDVLKIITSVLIGVLIAAPMFMWNMHNHFASFLFQTQHGFGSDRWHPTHCFVFMFLSALYLTPWFAFSFLKNGLCSKRHFYLILPVCALISVLLFSSLRNHTLPTWISPAFWMLIPYAVIYCKPSSLDSMLKQCKYTALIWVPLVITLSLPGGMWNLKQFIHLLHGDNTKSWFTLFWTELPTLVRKDDKLAPLLEAAFLQQTQNKNCAKKQIIIGVFARKWAAQLEYQRVFPGAKILNLEQKSSNFYLWRDDWADYANCDIIFIGEGDANILDSLQPILTIKNQNSLHGIGDYPAMDLQIASGTLKDRYSIESIQRGLLINPKY